MTGGKRIVRTGQGQDVQTLTGGRYERTVIQTTTPR